MTATDTAVELAQLAATAAAAKLGTDIVLIDVSDRLAITDIFVIISGSNERQVEAIVDAVEDRLRAASVKPLRREGKRDGRWVLLDFADIVVHVQHVEERVFYSLERLWKDCPFIAFTDPATGITSPGRPGVDRELTGQDEEFEGADTESELASFDIEAARSGEF